MARSRETETETEPAPLAPVVTRGDNVALPRPARRAEPRPATPRVAQTPKVRARAHGDRSRDIGGRSPAGDAFAAWLRSKGLDPDQRYPAATLAELTREFAARPIHGHRRSGSGGDNHDPNPEHLRK